MRSKKNILVGASFVILFLISACFAGDVESVSQTVADYNAILKANPMSPGEKAQLNKIVGDETATLFVSRFAEGAEIKPHFHKNHSESIYVIAGSGQMVIDGKRLEVSPGTIHFNPMNKVHSIINTGKTDLVVFQIFTPAWKEVDRIFVP